MFRKYLILLTLLFAAKISFSQLVKGTVTKTGDNKVTVYAKPSSAINNFLALNFNICISFPVQTQTPVVNITSNYVASLGWQVLTPFNLGGRTFIVLLGSDNNNTTTTSWTTGDNPIIQIEFGGGAPGIDELIQLNDLTANDGGENGQAYWFIDFQVLGDRTDYDDKFYVTTGSQNFVDGNVTGNSSVETSEQVMLPVKLRGFTAERYKERYALLQWKSSSESNLQQYEIERSSDGINFEYTGMVSARGQQYTDQRYTYLDEQLPINRDVWNIYYYRLKMVDFDGSYAYSDVKAVSFGHISDESLMIYPNPASDVLHIDLSAWDSEQEPVQIFAVDTKGKLVFQKKVSNNGVEIIDVSTWQAGSFMIYVRQGTSLLSGKVILVR